MKKTIFITLCIIVTTGILIESGVAGSLLLFLLVGAVPGTSITISPTVMLIAIGLITWGLFIRVAAVEALRAFAIKKLAAKRQARRKSMPRRRFSQI